MIENLKIKVFADVATEDEISTFNKLSYIKGFTTNPSLLKKAGVSDYEVFAKAAASLVGNKSISFEIVADKESQILDEAYAVASWADNIYVKIPFLKTDGSDNTRIIKTLAQNGVKLNITALMTVEQVTKTIQQADINASMIISVFAGRIADTGVDPLSIMNKCVSLLQDFPKVELLWASAREIFNVIQAENCRCDIITLTADLLKKFKLWGTDLNEYSRQTAQMFYNDAKSAGLKINTNRKDC